MRISTHSDAQGRNVKEEGSCGGRRGKEGGSQHEAAAWDKDVTRRSEAEDEDTLTIKS